MLLANMAITALTTAASISNYPGGEALMRFNRRFEGASYGAFLPSPPSLLSSSLWERRYWILMMMMRAVHIHISNLAAQSGASLFLQTHAPPHLPSLLSVSLSHPAHVPTQHARVWSWTYNKTENLPPSTLSSQKYTHLIAEQSEIDGWRVVGSGEVEGFDKWELDKGIIEARDWGNASNVLRMTKEPKLWILERRGVGGWLRSTQQQQMG